MASAVFETAFAIIPEEPVVTVPIGLDRIQIPVSIKVPQHDFSHIGVSGTKS